MIKIEQCKIHAPHTETELLHKIAKVLSISPQEIKEWSIIRQSLDARKRPQFFYVYTIEVSLSSTGAEKKVLKKWRPQKGKETLSFCVKEAYHFPAAGELPLSLRPIVVGTGPAGLFCGYFLARHGYRPILIEQGAPVEERQQDVEAFWKTGILNPDSNVQFGEGGAGTFSDGKLNTLVKDPGHRIRAIFEIFVAHGAPKSILYESKPHIGTDVLCRVISSMREEMIGWGAEFHFHTKMTDLLLEESRVTGIVCIDLKNSTNRTFSTQQIILALGHSSRDTFELLYKKGISMQAKSFAVGVRCEHPQQMINEKLYGSDYPENFGAAAYKLSCNLPTGRGVYSFCMCPGGYVVNASSEEKMTAVNGMSYHDRGSANANSALIVTVTPDDFGSQHPLAGIQFQRDLEQKAYAAGQGKIPVQRFRDFYEHVCKTSYPESSVPSKVSADFSPCMKGTYEFTDITTVFPDFISRSIIDGILDFDYKIQGFADGNILLSAVESRTSSPVRIQRNENFESNISGLYPCGEGAGYAGGITSAAMDGLKLAEMLRSKFKPFHPCS